MIATRLLNEARGYAAATVQTLVGRWNERRAIDRLAAYPDEMLKDIGVSRGELPFVVRCSRDRDKARRHPVSSGRTRTGGNVAPLRAGAAGGARTAHGDLRVCS
jgi:uncharacterized protein YjiS (DUF1127 family)